jgi:hypothetical protein
MINILSVSILEEWYKTTRVWAIRTDVHGVCQW